MSARLVGRNVLVTGATGGLGRCLAARFRREGANVILTGRSASALDLLATELRADGGPPCLVIADDLSDPLAPARIIERARASVASLDVLINNAAVQGPIGPVWENDWADWQHALQVNLVAPVALCRLAVPWMRERSSPGHAKIINLAGGGASAGRPGFSAYGAAKAALVRFSETLAMETRGLAIDVNSIAPGVMKTAMTEAVLAAGASAAGAEEYRRASELTRSGAGQTTEERASALCAFLASAESDGITGKLLSAPWDPWETLHQHREDLAKSDVYTLRRIVPADRGLSC